jgi:hypothetical protein
MKYWVVIAWMFCGGLLNAQEGIKINDRVVMDVANSPIVWIDSMKTDVAHLVMDKAGIDSIYILKDSVVNKKYSHVMARGSLIIVPKPTVELVRLPALLERLGVPANDRNLRVCINKTLVRYPTLLLIQPDQIKTIEVTTERHWTYPEEANSKELFLNFITKVVPLSQLN